MTGAEVTVGGVGSMLSPAVLTRWCPRAPKGGLSSMFPKHLGGLKILPCTSLDGGASRRLRRAGLVDVLLLKYELNTCVSKRFL